MKGVDDVLETNSS